MAFPERHYGTGLRPIGAFRMLRDKADFVPDLQLVEAVVSDAVAVKINLVTIGGLDKPAVFFGQQTRDMAVIRHRVQLHVAPRNTRMVFEQPLGGIERLADRDEDILVFATTRRVASDNNLAPRNCEVDADPMQIALTVAGVPALNGYAAGDDPIEEAVELLGPFADPRLYRGRSRHMAKGYLEG
jgi:hypothetical protein